MNQTDSNIAPPNNPHRTWPIWVLFAGSLSPFGLIAINWNVIACCTAVLIVALWLAIGFKYYNIRGFIEPFDLLASLSCITSFIAIGVAIWRWVS